MKKNESVVGMKRLKDDYAYINMLFLSLVRETARLDPLNAPSRLGLTRDVIERVSQAPLASFARLAVGTNLLFTLRGGSRDWVRLLDTDCCEDQKLCFFTKLVSDSKGGNDA